MCRPGSVPTNPHRCFEFCLSQALEGGMVRTGMDLDEQTTDALNEIAWAFPNIGPDLIEAAHSAFARQLEGSNAASDRDEMLRFILADRERRARSEPTE